ncbi:MAG: PEP-CTERM sorting domain-containing protein [Hydrogenophilales bacterium]|nr:PEP-CTERM sorting domain-containing protein [Hydrogenophilales bacterium]
MASVHAVFLLLAASAATASPFFFSTGNPDGKMGTASRPASAGLFGIESADDFVLSQQTKISSATFTGLLTGRATTADIGSVGVEIYRVFPSDSDVGRTSGAPTFSTSMVPTRVNSPADVAFDTRTGSGLGFSVSSLGSFTVANSVLPGGIHPLPNPMTGGDGAVTGSEVEFAVNFVTPFDLAAGHYFFVPLVELTGGDFLWLSAPRPIVPPGTPFPPGSTDLQTWTRDDFLAPDWLRVGTDIVGGSPAPTFNAVFSLTGESAASGSIPEPGSLFLVVAGSLALLVMRRLKPAVRRRAI